MSWFFKTRVKKNKQPAPGNVSYLIAPLKNKFIKIVGFGIASSLSPLLVNLAGHSVGLGMLVKFKISRAVGAIVGSIVTGIATRIFKPVIMSALGAENSHKLSWYAEFGAREFLTRPASYKGPLKVASKVLTTKPPELQLQETDAERFNHLKSISADVLTTEQHELFLTNFDKVTLAVEASFNANDNSVATYKNLLNILSNIDLELCKPSIQVHEKQAVLLNLSKSFGACQKQWLDDAEKQLMKLQFPGLAIEAQLAHLAHTIKLDIISQGFKRFYAKVNDVHVAGNFRKLFKDDWGLLYSKESDGDTILRNNPLLGYFFGLQEKSLENTKEGWHAVMKRELTPLALIEGAKTVFIDAKDGKDGKPLGKADRDMIIDALTPWMQLQLKEQIENQEIKVGDIAEIIANQYFNTSTADFDAKYILNDEGVIALLKAAGYLEDSVNRIHMTKDIATVIKEAKDVTIQIPPPSSGTSKSMS